MKIWRDTRRQRQHVGRIQGRRARTVGRSLMAFARANIDIIADGSSRKPSKTYAHYAEVQASKQTSPLHLALSFECQLSWSVRFFLLFTSVLQVSAPGQPGRRLSMPLFRMNVRFVCSFGKKKFRRSSNKTRRHAKPSHTPNATVMRGKGTGQAPQRSTGPAQIWIKSQVTNEQCW